MGLYNLSLDCDCCASRYHVFTTKHFGFGQSCRSPFSMVPQTQWDEAWAQAWERYQFGGGGSPNGPGPCQEPLGWLYTHAFTGAVNPETGLYEVQAGSSPLVYFYWDGPPNTFSPPFQLKYVNGHVGMAASGIFKNDGISAFQNCASATYGTTAWVFMVPAPEGKSLRSEYGYYNLDFFLRSQPSDFGATGLNNIPSLFIKHAEQQGITNTWINTPSDATELGGFKMVVGNAAGKVITSLTTVPSGAITDTTSATYWVTKHLLRGDYKEVVDIPPPPRSGDIVRLEMTTDENGTKFDDFFEENSDEGLDSTTEITDPPECQLGLPNGSVWFLAIIPESMCMENILPGDLEFVRTTQPRDPWFTQLLGDNKTSSLNIARLEGGKVGVTEKTILAPPVGNPTLNI